MYERFFGLVDAPFRLTPDPRYLFLSPKHAEALAHLRLGLTETSGFVCITGDVGTGKTTLLRAFLAELGPEVTAAYIFTPPSSPFELVQRIIRELGVGVTSGSHLDLVDALNAHLIKQREAGRVCVVVVDEAQAFTLDLLEQLRLLSNLETATEKLLRLVLVGQPQLRTLLMDPSIAQLNQRITLRWHMGPLTYRETVAYVRHRLGVASAGRVTQLFSTPALRLLHALSGGIPRLVNMIAHRAMLAAFVVRRPRITRRSVLRAYKEIKNVPLPGSTSTVRRAAWASAGAALGVGLVTLGAPRLARQAPVRPPAANAVVEQLAPPAIPSVETAAVPPGAEPPSAADPAASPVGEPQVSAGAVVDLEHRLAATDSAASARAAVATILAAWQVRPLAPNETRVPDDLEQIAWRRGLDDLALTGNRSMLRLLDLPALVELRVPGGDGPRYAALTGLDEGRLVLTIDGTPVTVEPALLDRFWLGQAHVLWRDFEGLGPTFGKEGRGVPVARLQALLKRAGLYDGAPNGAFDAGTAAAVIDFQRSRLLAADGRVGRLTRIVLYGAAGGYQRPTLTLTGATS
jgi:general secretion pathway protein A